MRNERNTRFEEAKKLLLANGGNRVGEKIACIGWDGSVYPDQFWRNYRLGNIRERTFAQIWQDTSDSVLYKLRHKDQFADTRCLKCIWFTLCKGNCRFLGANPAGKYWLNEPACYLTDNEIIRTAQLSER
jgi:radical SAM protein with 4Fe4S-binding SPASM domain